MKKYDAFYKELGMIRENHFRRGRINPYENLLLPRNSVVHHLEDVGETMGPTQTHPPLKLYSGKIRVIHVKSLNNPQGGVRPITSASVTQLIKGHRKTNPDLRPIESIRSIGGDGSALAIVNHAFLDQLYHYTTGAFSDYYKAFNRVETLFSELTNQLKASARHQFVLVATPTSLPNTQGFRKAASEKPISRNQRGAFNNIATALYLELWRWISGQESLIDNLDENQLGDVDFLFLTDQGWATIDLASIKRFSGVGSGNVKRAQELLHQFFTRMKSNNGLAQSQAFQQEEESSPDSE